MLYPNEDIIVSCSHCSCTIFILTSYSLCSQVILILSLIDVQYLRIVFSSLEKVGMVNSLLCRFPPLSKKKKKKKKKIPQQNFPFCPTVGIPQLLRLFWNWKTGIIWCWGRIRLFLEKIRYLKGKIKSFSGTNRCFWGGFSFTSKIRCFQGKIKLNI